MSCQNIFKQYAQNLIDYEISHDPLLKNERVILLRKLHEKQCPFSKNDICPLIEESNSEYAKIAYFLHCKR